MRDRLGDWLAENDAMHWSIVVWVIAVAVVVWTLVEWLA